MKGRKTIVLFVFALMVIRVNATDFSIVSKRSKACIVYAPGEAALDSIAAHLLAKDIERVTGYLPVVLTDITKAKGNVIVIGRYSSKLIETVCGSQYEDYSNLAGQWECYVLKVLTKPSAKISNALIIAGSDPRGTAYGVFAVSEKIGVSPWYWWADVQPVKKKKLVISQDEFVSALPSVKYRGVFLNDEDWGLQPWAAKTYEPETGDIGPKTYARIFELLLRLKANLIWPAMHPSTKAFYHYDQNKNVAADYSIVIGSSHAEPMLRNNVGEWDHHTMGDFNYIKNRQRVYEYWKSRVKESQTNEAIYTLGMRGVHDSGMEGIKGSKEAIPLLTEIVEDQRRLLKKYIDPDVQQIPQVFTAYKEVLDIYDNGLRLPEDVTLVWPDDNYGYIQRLSNEAEQKRAGAAGVYYHASYWGRPHDYLWLSSTHPALIREEMMKAYENKTDRVWVLNVGDIKPLEYNVQLFLDMAYDTKPFANSSYVKTHLQRWHQNIFGTEKGSSMSAVMWEYYQLAFERRPEFMGWSRTEPTTQTTYSAYNHFYYGDEAQRRIDQYKKLEKQVGELQTKISKARADAFYQLVYYPVTCASLMNKKFLYRDKAYLYARQRRLSAHDYASLSKKAYDDIVFETDYYNNRLANGKWKHMMHMKPRNLPVYQEAVLPDLSLLSHTEGWRIAPEGMVYDDSSLVTGNADTMMLPAFNSLHNSKYFIDVFLCDSQSVNWSAIVSDDWITVSQSRGVLLPEAGKSQLRIWAGIDKARLPAGENITGKIILTGNGKEFIVTVTAFNPGVPGLKSFTGGMEKNGYITLKATSFTGKKDTKDASWSVYEDLGHTGNVLVARSAATAFTDTGSIRAEAPYVEYDFYTFTAASPEVIIASLPTHPLNNHYSMRYAVAVDDSPVQVVDFRTFGRSEEWKQNVLRNSAEKRIKFSFLEQGRHTLKIYMVDPGVMLDRIHIDLGGLKNAYSVIPETRVRK